MSKLKKLLFSLNREERLLPLLKKHVADKARKENEVKGFRKAYVQNDAQMTVDCFAERKQEYDHDDPETKDYFHPSQIGQCMRKLWYRSKGAPTNGAPQPQDLLKSHLIFEIGTYAHVMLQNLLQAAGVLEKREAAVRCDKRKIIGHADGILRFSPKERSLLELKTINARGFSKLGEPKTEHQMQVLVYMNLLGLDDTSFLYYDKDSADLKEFIFPNDERRWKTEIAPRIQRYHDHACGNKAPEREGTNPSAFPCAWCEYSSVCFNTLKPWTPIKKAAPVRFIKTVKLQKK